MKLFLIIVFVLTSICIFYYLVKREKIRRNMKSDRLKQKINDILEDVRTDDE